MNYHREFEIGWFGMALGLHEFHYEMDQDKLARLELPAIENIGNFKFDIKLNFDKKSSFFLLKFELSGQAQTVCDRCGDDLTLEVWDEFDLVVKLAHDVSAASTNEDDDADIVFINRNETVIDISEWIYEFIQLSLPIQSVHGETEEGLSLCNAKALEVLEAHSIEEEYQQDAEEEEEPPQQNAKDIWKDLDKFKF